MVWETFIPYLIMLTIDQINEILLNQYGTALNGKARFRLINRDNEFEKRFGEFEDWEGSIFIRRVKEARLLIKYSFVTPGSYILERYVAEDFADKWPAQKPPEDVLDWSGYEPFYAFDLANTPAGIPPIRAILFVIQTNLFTEKIKKSYKSMFDEDEAKIAKAKAEFLAMLDDANPWVANALAEGEAIAVPSNYGDKIQ